MNILEPRAWKESLSKEGDSQNRWSCPKERDWRRGSGQPPWRARLVATDRKSRQAPRAGVPRRTGEKEGQEGQTSSKNGDVSWIGEKDDERPPKRKRSNGERQAGRGWREKRRSAGGGVEIFFRGSTQSPLEKNQRMGGSHRSWNTSEEGGRESWTEGGIRRGIEG